MVFSLGFRHWWHCFKRFGIPTARPTATAYGKTDCFWSVHYCFLAAWSGAAVCALGAVRETVFRRVDYKSCKGKLWLAFFLVCSIVIAALTWESVFSVLPSLGSVLSVISFWIGNPRLSRLLQIVISGAFLTYNVVYLSYAGMISEVILLISLFVTLIRQKSPKT